MKPPDPDADPDAAKLLRWYPRGWRERYGEEFLAMVEAATGQGRAGTMTMLAGIPQLFRLL